MPPQLSPFLSIVVNKSQEVHNVDKQNYDTEQRMDWGMPKLKKEKTQDETFIPHDFATSLNNFTGAFDVNAIPGLMPQSDMPGQLNPNPFDLVPFKIPPTTRVTRSGEVLRPIDVRTILGTGNSQRQVKTDVREPIRGPIDIRNMPSNQYNDLLWGSDSHFGVRGVGARRNKKEKSLAGLPAKQQELGVSKRLSKLEKLIRMDENEMTEKQRREKLRLMRLEKNRRAAAVSRERKKRYIKSLEERSLIMSKHLEALELENGQLRQLLGQNNRQKSNTLNHTQPNLPSLERSSFDNVSNHTISAARKRIFWAMNDMNIPESADEPEGSKSARLTIKSNHLPLAQTTVKEKDQKRMRVENEGLERPTMCV